jgi:hypothetical protein
MFTGISHYKNSGRHDPHNFRPLCDNPAMKLVIRILKQELTEDTELFDLCSLRCVMLKKSFQIFSEIYELFVVK